jgi:hypothetical protein
MGLQLARSVSATSLLVATNATKIVIVIFGTLSLGDTATPLAAAGLALALVGNILYMLARLAVLEGQARDGETFDQSGHAKDIVESIRAPAGESPTSLLPMMRTLLGVFRRPPAPSPASGGGASGGGTAGDRGRRQPTVSSDAREAGDDDGAGDGDDLRRRRMMRWGGMAAGGRWGRGGCCHEDGAAVAAAAVKTRSARPRAPERSQPPPPLPPPQPPRRPPLALRLVW